MNLFSISQLQQFSGIKAHTIRIWEQRYDALQPERSDGNTRYYSNLQLRRLLNIVSLMGYEYKISELCSMSDEMLFKIISGHLKNFRQANIEIEYSVTQLIAAGISLDENYFKKLFSSCVVRYGIKNTYTKVIYPMLARIGLMWANDTMPPSQEHFISNIIRQKLFSAIDVLATVKSEINSWLLFLPENEFHEIGLLFANYLIRSSGAKVFYLGTNIPIDTLTKIVKDISPDNILFFLVHNNIPKDAQKYLNTLSQKFRKSKIYISGNEKLLTQLNLTKSVKWIRTVEDLEKYL